MLLLIKILIFYVSAQIDQLRENIWKECVWNTLNYQTRVSKMDILGFGIQMVESIKMIEEGWIVLN